MASKKALQIYRLDQQFFNAYRAGRSPEEALQLRPHREAEPLNDDLINLFLGEGGFANIKNKDQSSFNFAPIDVPGKTKSQLNQELMNQILQAPDSNISKRELLGVSKQLKKKSRSTPLFQGEEGENLF